MVGDSNQHTEKEDLEEKINQLIKEFQQGPIKRKTGRQIQVADGYWEDIHESGPTPRNYLDQKWIGSPVMEDEVEEDHSKINAAKDELVAISEKNANAAQKVMGILDNQSQDDSYHSSTIFKDTLEKFLEAAPSSVFTPYLENRVLSLLSNHNQKDIKYYLELIKNKYPNKINSFINEIYSKIIKDNKLSFGGLNVCLNYKNWQSGDLPEVMEGLVTKFLSSTQYKKHLKKFTTRFGPIKGKELTLNEFKSFVSHIYGNSFDNIFNKAYYKGDKTKVVNLILPSLKEGSADERKLKLDLIIPTLAKISDDKVARDGLVIISRKNEFVTQYVMREIRASHSSKKKLDDFLDAALLQNSSSFYYEHLESYLNLVETISPTKDSVANYNYKNWQFGDLSNVIEGVVTGLLSSTKYKRDTQKYARSLNPAQSKKAALGTLTCFVSNSYNKAFFNIFNKVYNEGYKTKVVNLILSSLEGGSANRRKLKWDLLIPVLGKIADDKSVKYLIERYENKQIHYVGQAIETAAHKGSRKAAEYFFKKHHSMGRKVPANELYNLSRNFGNSKLKSFKSAVLGRLF